MEQVNGNRVSLGLRSTEQVYDICAYAALAAPQMGWALGAIMYEINEYPWALEPPAAGNIGPGNGDGPGQSWWMLALAAAIGECSWPCAVARTSLTGTILSHDSKLPVRLLSLSVICCIRSHQLTESACSLQGS
jgi:hypothetical protein